MNGSYAIVTLDESEIQRLKRTRDDLLVLSECEVPSVRAAARLALAQIQQAMNGQGLSYELYTSHLSDR
jgi:hypothetical protein